MDAGVIRSVNARYLKSKTQILFLNPDLFIVSPAFFGEIDASTDWK